MPDESTERKCPECRDTYNQQAFQDGEQICMFCADKKRFSAFATSCGLERYPDPTGERYIYNVDGSIDGKKSECVDFMTDLWNALVKAKGGDKALLVE